MAAASLWPRVRGASMPLCASGQGAV